MIRKYFVTGTDTDVGKTLVSAILALMFDAIYWKPIQSGTADALADSEQVKQWTQLSNEHFLPTCYSLKASLSPDQAAKLENISIDMSQCILPEMNKSLIVEGAGGVMVPLNQQERMIDLIYQLKLPAIIVARGKLGTINHTLLTIEALRHKNIPIHGVIFNGELNPNSKKSIEYWGQVKTLLQVPYFNKIDHAVLQDWIVNQDHFMETEE